MRNGKKVQSQPWPKVLRLPLFELADEVSLATLGRPVSLWSELCETSDGPSRDRATGFLLGLAVLAGAEGGASGVDGRELFRPRWARKSRALLNRLALLEAERPSGNPEETNGQATASP